MAEKRMHFICQSVKVFSTKSTNIYWGQYFFNWRREKLFTWSSKPCEGLASCNAKGVPFFSQFFSRP